MNWSHAQPNARAAGIFLARKFHIATVYCYDYRPNTADPSQLSDHAFGAADDFMGGGWDLAKYAQAHAAVLQITYVIHDHKIWSVARSKEGWRPYTGPNPHTDHVHVSFVRTGAHLSIKLPSGSADNGDNTAPGGSQASPALATNVSLPSAVSGTGKLIDAVTSAAFWIRVLMFIGGLVLVLLATGTLAIAQLAIKKVSTS